MFEIKRTKTQDLLVIMRIVNMTKEVFAEQGIDQWQKGYPKKGDFLQDIMMNESYAIFEDDCVVGTFMLSVQKEPTYDTIYEGAWLQDGAYATMHRFTIDPISRRHGLGEKTFKEVESMLKKKNEVSSIRVDTHEDNQPMQNLLKKVGFEYVGVIYLKNGDKRLAYEKVL